MKRLFCVVDRSTGKIVGDYYPSKEDAKKSRDSLNPPLKDDANADAFRQYYVSFGPDHRRYDGKR